MRASESKMGLERMRQYGHKIRMGKPQKGAHYDCGRTFLAIPQAIGLTSNAPVLGTWKTVGT
jgi:hypothetical protein